MMKAPDSIHCALSCCVVAIMLAGCGGAQAQIGAPGAMPQNYPIDGTAAVHHQTFAYTGAKQSFTVPSGVKSIAVVALGAAGSAYSYRERICQGRGGRVFAVIPVTPNQRLSVYVGGEGSFTGGGFNGGGAGAGSYAGWGGGASDVRIGPGGFRDRLVVSGGGGGEGSNVYFGSGRVFGCGGGGGGLVGGKGRHGAGVYVRSVGRSDQGGGRGGHGGTQSAGGNGGLGGTGSVCTEPGDAGSRGTLGVGGDGARNSASYGGASGGGGGGGYFGGGGGGSSCVGTSSYIGSGGGGGGGSSYAEPSATKVRMWQNWKTATGNGLVVFSWR